MARKLTPEEELRFAEILTEAEIFAKEDVVLDQLARKRDVLLALSPELRSFFDKEPKHFFSKE